ncbi:hypothetical protein FE784_40095 [Paenibacillus hemerocallicola]|uniref:Uncharacterized protein n=1 Tax=Paenibacillus hemerocallicola TaxID=1172614 RepID=A0A5C4SVB3_9BACL|nr:hypothetical protein [Paenibacillus hemerocallicola]TNJ54096.1 hypothetical protein FE784_40095 [Paenibacillus hemerocallicola]
MIPILINLILIIGVIGYYSIIKNQIRRGLFFDVTLLNKLKYLILPLFMAIGNLILSLIYGIFYLILTFVFGLIPVVAYFYEKRITSVNIRSKNELTIQISPMIQAKASQVGVNIHVDDINVIFDYKSKTLHVYVKVPSRSNGLKKYLNQLIEDTYQGYNTRVFLEEEPQKKSNLAFI